MSERSVGRVMIGSQSRSDRDVDQRNSVPRQRLSGDLVEQPSEFHGNSFHTATGTSQDHNQHMRNQERYPSLNSSGSPVTTFPAPTQLNHR